VKRKRTDLVSTIQRDAYGEWWLHAGYRIPDYEEIPSAFSKDHHDHANEVIDRLMGDALLDAMAQYWIPVPPMQHRDRRLGSWEGLTSITLERRIRMLKPTVLEDATLVVRWPVDPLDGNFEWRPYVPTYEDDDDPVRATVQRDRQAEPFRPDVPRSLSGGGPR
jgi:hypothetical protein